MPVKVSIFGNQIFPKELGFTQKKPILVNTNSRSLDEPAFLGQSDLGCDCLHVFYHKLRYIFMQIC